MIDSEIIEVEKFITKAAQDGTLFFQAQLNDQGQIMWSTCMDHTAIPGADFMLTPWDSGLEVSCWSGDDWLPPPWEFDWKFVLVKNELDYKYPSLLMATFVDRIPGPFLQLLPFYQHGQLPVLRLLHRWGHRGHELACQSPILFLLIVEKRDILGEWQLDTILRSSQKEILCQLGYTGTKSAVYFLRRIKLSAITCELLGTISSILRDEKILKSMRHYPEIVETHLLAAEQCPQIFRYKMFNRVKRKDGESLEQFCIRGKAVMDMYQDVCRLAELTNITIEPRLAKAKRVYKLIEMHRELVWEMRNRSNRQQLLAEWGESFPPPPVPGNDDIQPIKTVSELIQEGDEMLHCVAIRAENIFATGGNCYIYKIKRPQRATAEIVVVNGKAQLESLKLASNDEPEQATYELVTKWLSRTEMSRR